MESVAGLPKRVAWLQTITLVWMVFECAASLLAAAQAHSAALLAFGSDSFIELLSAIVVLLQFLPRFPLKRSQAEKAAAILLFLLAAAVACIAALDWHGPLETSTLGIAVTALALIVMPLLARLKRNEAMRTGDGALDADSTQSATCAYLAAITLVGLVVFALWRITWIDSVAALAAVPILLIEGRRTWRGEGCACGSAH